MLDDRYRLVAPVGSGASAHVFLADDTRLRRRVAVKLLQEVLASDQHFLRRFEAEARLVAGLNHPHILAVHDWGHDGVPYLVTEYLAGGSLRSLLDSGIRLSESQALVVGLEAARALDHAHRRGLIHRDIKPDNLLFDDEGRLRIADFGLARALAESAITEPTGAFFGSARYASPEQARGSNLDGRSDIYSLALVLAEAVTGALAFDADTQLATLMARTERDFDPGESAGALRRPLLRAGRLEAAERPDADEFAVSLMATAEQLPRPEPLALGRSPVAEPAPGDRHDTTVVAASPDGDVSGAADAAAAGADASALTGPTDLDAGPGGAAGLGGERTDLSRRDRKVLARRERRRQRTDRLAAIERGEVRRRRWPWAIVAVVLLAAGAVAGWLVWDNNRVESFAAPNVIGASVDDLPDLLVDHDLVIRRLETRAEATTPGEVVAQDPEPGTAMEPGDELVVTVSLGEPLAAVPTDLVGLDLDAAGLQIEAALLTVGEVTQVFDEVAPAGQVMEVTTVLPELERGSPVDLVVSQGPAPRPVPADLVGIAVDDAVAAVEAARLSTSISEEYSDEVDQGLVISVEPESGTEVPVDSVVEILVSLGPEPVPVPDVEGLGITEAQRIIEEAGLVVIEIEGPPAQPVLTTDPPAGTEVFRGDRIVIFTVGAGTDG